ncbi:MAG: transcriptional regulator PpsR [Lysobacterales bacterium]
MAESSSPKINEQFVADLSSQQIASIVASANDLALVVDNQGIIRDVAVENPRGAMTQAPDWVGQPWVETVTVESRPKIEALMSESDGAPSRWRQVNHPAADGLDLPIMYRTFSANDHAIVVGKDLRPLSQVQQQLMDVQHSMENEYARLHHAETRYRMLFQLAAEAILILDSDGKSIQEANPAAAQLLGESVAKLVRRSLVDYLEQVDLTELLAESRSAGHGAELKVNLKDNGPCTLSATLLRQGDAVLYLVHLTPVNRAPALDRSDVSQSTLAVVKQSPDGFVVTDVDGQIIAGNEAFVQMCQLGSEGQLKNQPLERWLGRSGVDMRVIRKNLSQRGVVRQYGTTISPEFGTPLEVELSGVSAINADPPCFGFVIRQLRSASRSDSEEKFVKQPLGRSLEQMTELVGRVPLKDLVRETTDLIERLCIQAALELTTNNRASAADMLGLSRQSLYVKLRRYGIADAGAADKD